MNTIVRIRFIIKFNTLGIVGAPFYNRDRFAGTKNHLRLESCLERIVCRDYLCGAPETYVGFDRTRNFASPGGAQFSEDRAYQFPPDLEPNHWALEGNWIIGHEATMLSKGSGGLRHRFRARDLHLVMGPQAKEVPVRFRVLIDGKPPGDSQGTDVDENGYGTIVEPRMYQLIRQTGRISERIFEIQFLDPRIEIFSITFG